MDLFSTERYSALLEPQTFRLPVHLTAAPNKIPEGTTIIVAKIQDRLFRGRMIGEDLILFARL